MFPTLTEIWNWLNGIVSQIADYVGNLFGPVATWIGNLLNQISAAFNSLQTQIVNQFNTIMAAVSQWLSSALTKLINVFDGVVSAIWAFVGPWIEKFKQFVDNIWQGLQGVFHAVITELGAWANDVFNYLAGSIRAVVDTVKAFVVGLGQEITAFIRGLLQPLTDAFNGQVDQIKRGIDELIGDSQALVTQIGEKLGDVKTAFADAATELLKGIEALPESLAESLKPVFEDVFGSLISIGDAKSMDGILAIITNSLSANTLDVGGLQKAEVWTKSLMPTNPTARVIFLIVVSTMLLSNVFSGISQANAQMLLQEYALKFPYQPLSPADATAAVMRGGMDRSDAVRVIQRQGYTEADAQRLIDNGSAIPAIGELLAMKLRGIVDDDTFQKATIRLGYTQSWENAYVELAQIIPPVSDLITMAVKGAFSDDEIALFRTMEDFPSSIVEHGEKQGISKEWLERYWAAHWNLPSPSQGFEMFQRDIIKEPELKTLLKALDVTPFWRDKMIQLSYNVLTRVDIRRIHQLQRKDHEWLVKQHLNLGYSPEDAEILAKFTEDLNQNKPGESDEELGRLSRTNIIGFYQDGVIPRDRAIQLLVGVGYTEEAATLFIDTADFDAERQLRAAEIDFIIASAVAGVLDWNSAQNKLAELHLSPIEIEKASAKLAREQSKATKLPTVEQGTKMFTSKVISEESFRDLLRRLGYRAEWQNAFIALAKQNPKPAN